MIPLSGKCKDQWVRAPLDIEFRITTSTCKKTHLIHNQGILIRVVAMDLISIRAEIHGILDDWATWLDEWAVWGPPGEYPIQSWLNTAWAVIVFIVFFIFAVTLKCYVLLSLLWP